MLRSFCCCSGRPRCAQTWETWDDSPPGTPPDVVLEPSSNTDATTFTITNHGFYVDETIDYVSGVPTIFHRVIVPAPEVSTIPGLVFDPATSPRLAGTHALDPDPETVGKPELPYDAELVGVVTDADATLGTVTVSDPNPQLGDPDPGYFRLTDFNGHPIAVRPSQPPTLDCECCSSPGPFTLDEVLAEPSTSWRTDEIQSAELENACMTPPVIAMACCNGKFDNGRNCPVGSLGCCAALGPQEDGIGEQWLKVGSIRGAVAHYGAVTPSWTDVNDDHNLALFHEIYVDKVPVLGVALNAAEETVITKHKKSGEENVMVYEYMGDPGLEVRITTVPKSKGKGFLAGCPFGGAIAGFIPPDSTIGKCAGKLAKVGAKLIKAIIDCHRKRASGKLGTVIDEQACVDAARVKFDTGAAGVTGCPTCATNNLAAIKDQAETMIAATNGLFFCAGSTPFGGNDTGSIPPDKTVGTCEDKLDVLFAKLVGGLVTCHKKRAAEKLLDPTATLACETKALATFDAAAAKLKDCPPCIAGNLATIKGEGQSRLGAANGLFYCASADTP